jgi:hypothetical protein
MENKMGQQYSAIPDKLARFIQQQKLFFVGTATAESRVNVSPKGMDSLRVLDANRVIWLNVTGSGNETAAHVQVNPRMTIMFAAFDGSPMILRLYGQAKAVHHNDSQWAALMTHFGDVPGARQIFDMQIDLVQSSCGMAVPLFEYQAERDQLKNWAEKQGEEGIHTYWRNKNQHTIDGIDTHIVALNLDD